MLREIRKQETRREKERVGWDDEACTLTIRPLMEQPIEVNQELDSLKKRPERH